MFYCRCCPVNCNVFSNIPGPFPGEANSNTRLPSSENQKCLQIVPAILGRRRVKITLRVEALIYSVWFQGDRTHLSTFFFFPTKWVHNDLEIKSSAVFLANLRKRRKKFLSSRKENFFKWFIPVHCVYPSYKVKRSFWWPKSECSKALALHVVSVCKINIIPCLEVLYTTFFSLLCLAYFWHISHNFLKYFHLPNSTKFAVLF